MNYGIGQKFDPHSLRTGILDHPSSSNWIDESCKTEGTYMLGNNLMTSVDSKSGLYITNKLSGISICSLDLFERKVKLEKVLGINNYRKLVNKVKKLSR